MTGVNFYVIGLTRPGSGLVPTIFRIPDLLELEVGTLLFRPPPPRLFFSSIAVLLIILP